MKVAIYTKEGLLATVYKGINNPKIKGSAIVFDGGIFDSIDERHLLLEDDVTPSEEMTPDMIQLDRKGIIGVIKTEEEEQAERIANLESALLFVLDMLP